MKASTLSIVFVKRATVIFVIVVMCVVWLVYVHTCVIICMYVQVHVHLCTPMEIVYFETLYYLFFEKPELTNWTGHRQVSSRFPTRGYSWLLCGCWDLNSGPHTSRAGPLITSLSIYLPYPKGCFFLSLQIYH